MEVRVVQLVPWTVVRDMAYITANKGDKIPAPYSSDELRDMLISEHSPIRAVTFRVIIENIPSFVATHLARHKFGVEPYVSTRRDDRFDTEEPVHRNTPVDMAMVLNPQALINISRKRLCTKSHALTIKTWNAVKEELPQVMASVMVPECVYRGFCPELKPCGYTETKNFEEALHRYRNI